MKVKAFQNLGRFISQNSPTIMTGLGVAGLITTVVMAVKATPKALQILDDEMYERDHDDGRWNNEIKPLTKRDIIELTWKCYAPAAAMGLVTIGCIVASNSINLRRNAALASVYSITEATLKEYQAKVVEQLGENKERKIRDDIHKDKVLKNPPKTSDVILTGKGDTLCLDLMSGRYFRSDIEYIRKIRNTLNEQLINSMVVTLNDLYYELGLRNVKQGEELGWAIELGLIEFVYSSQLTENEEPCLVLDYTVSPLFDSCDR